MTQAVREGAETMVNQIILDWEPPLPPADLLFDDGVPLESNRHRIAMNVLIDSALQALSSRSDVFTGGNMFVYYSRNQAMNRDFRGPDFFVALDVDGSRERQGWVVWEEEGRYGCDCGTDVSQHCQSRPGREERPLRTHVPHG